LLQAFGTITNQTGQEVQLIVGSGFDKLSNNSSYTFIFQEGDKVNVTATVLGTNRNNFNQLKGTTVDTSKSYNLVLASDNKTLQLVAV